MAERLARADFNSIRSIALTENTKIKQNVLEEAIKEVILQEKNYKCFYEPPFPVGERVRCPDFVITDLKVKGKAVILDPHNFGTDEQTQQVDKRDLNKWIEFKDKYRRKVYITFINHHTEEEVESWAGVSSVTFCDVFWQVEEKKDIEVVKDSIRTLLGEIEKKATHDSFCCPEAELNSLIRMN